jgi:hypothetical protein
MLPMYRLWENAELSLAPEVCTMLVDNTVHAESCIRTAAAEALATALEQHPHYLDMAMSRLLEMYEEKLYVSTILSHDIMDKLKIQR